jgi:uncharacterized protein (UPF0335 family)
MMSDLLKQVFDEIAKPGYDITNDDMMEYMAGKIDRLEKENYKLRKLLREVHSEIDEVIEDLKGRK